MLQSSKFDIKRPYGHQTHFSLIYRLKILADEMGLAGGGSDLTSCD